MRPLSDLVYSISLSWTYKVQLSGSNPPGQLCLSHLSFSTLQLVLQLEECPRYAARALRVPRYPPLVYRPRRKCMASQSRRGKE